MPNDATLKDNISGMSENSQFTFYQLVAMFLSESIRNRNVSLKRAAEIAKSVVEKLPQIRSEEEALLTIVSIEKDFEELSLLRQTLHFGYSKSDVKSYEKDIREFASAIFIDNMAQSAIFLQDASKEGMTVQELCMKYPLFCDFLSKSRGKNTAMAGFQEVFEPA